MSDRVLFLDTMIFLHFQPLEQIPWCEIFGAERITLAIARSVVTELDEKKDTGNGRVRHRARRALQAIHKGARGIEVRPGVTLIFRAPRPRIDFDEYGLDPTRGDDQLIASLLDYMNEYPAADVLLVSHDYGPILKGESVGLQVQQLPLEYQHLPELDPLEKELREIRVRLAKYEHAMPKLDVTFSDGEKHKQAVMSHWRQSSDEWVADQMEHVRGAHQKYPSEHWNNEPMSVVLGDFSKLMQCAPEEIERYNNELDAFFLDYEAYLREHETQLSARDRHLELDLVLTNDGTLPAEDIDLIFHLPDGFSVVSDLPLVADPPFPPAEPQTAMQMLAGALRSPLLQPADILTRGMPRIQENASRPRITKTSSYTIEMNVRYLKHGFVQKLDPFWVAFGQEDTPSPFTIECALIAANVPGVSESQLHVVVRVGESSLTE